MSCSDNTVLCLEKCLLCFKNCFVVFVVFADMGHRSSEVSFCFMPFLPIEEEESSYKYDSSCKDSAPIILEKWSTLLPVQ